MATTQIHGSRQIRDDTITNAEIKSDAAIALSKLAEAVIQADGGQAFTADQSVGGFKLTNLGTPTAAGDAAPKSYVDSAINGLAWKDNVRAATTANITLSGTQTIDGVSLSAEDDALVKNQTAPEENGIYTVKSGAWVRRTDADSWDELVSAAVVVDEGTVNADTIWRATVNEGGTLGTTAVTWDDFPGPQDITVSDTSTLDLTKTGNAISGAVLDSPLLQGQNSAYHLSRANHTGTQAASTIASFAEEVADVVGAMVTGNTETNITVTYDDTDNTLDFVVSVPSTRIVRETPSGAVNGSNTTYTLASTPTAGSEEVFLNGILQEPGAGNDYTISGGTITMLTAPETGERLRVSYVPQ